MARKGLGKGLGALLSAADADETSDSDSLDSQSGRRRRLEANTQIDIRKIEPNSSQPRQYFDDEALEELADSIREYGIIQPLILKDCGDYYSIIAGERRFRAARLAKLDSVPAIIKDYTELETLQIALIENIQREDLTPIEEAMCYKRLMDDFFFSQEDIATKIGKKRTAISNAIRLLDLDNKVQDLIAAGRLTVSHAKVLLTIKDENLQYELASKIAEEELSVRAAEIIVNSMLKAADEENAPKARTEPSPLPSLPDDVSAAYRRAEEELKSIFGAKVSIMQGKKKGKIEIEYYSPEELDRLLGLLGRKDRDTL